VFRGKASIHGRIVSAESTFSDGHTAEPSIILRGVIQHKAQGTSTLFYLLESALRGPRRNSTCGAAEELRRRDDGRLAEEAMLQLAIVGRDVLSKGINSAVVFEAKKWKKNFVSTLRTSFLSSDSSSAIFCRKPKALRFNLMY
jgi:hypothetical protein